MEEILTPDVVVIVHPINLRAHPTYKPGYRWAVQIGGSAPSDLAHCCQVGRADTIDEALIAGEGCGAAVCKAARMFGVPARYAVNRLTWDPIPPEADLIPHTTWDGQRQQEMNDGADR